MNCRIAYKFNLHWLIFKKKSAIEEMYMLLYAYTCG